MLPTRHNTTDNCLLKTGDCPEGTRDCEAVQHSTKQSFLAVKLCGTASHPAMNKLKADG